LLWTKEQATFSFFHATSGENLTFFAGYFTTNSTSTFAVPHHAWTPVAVAHKYTSGSAPTIRVNFQSVTPTQAGSGDPLSLGNGFCVGNVTSQTNTWAGRIAHVQVFNRLLSAAEMDACLKAPGSIPDGLRLWLPMTNETDVNDRSGNGFNGTRTDVTTGIDTPIYDNLFRSGVLNETVGRIAIPNSGHRGVLGLGPESSKLIADASVTDRFITTVNYPTTPVDSATIAGLTLDANKISTTTHPFIDYNTSGEWLEAAVADGVEVYAHRARITDCHIRGFRGNGATMIRPADNPQWGVFEQIDNCTIVQNFIGVYVTTSDQRVLNNMIANSRDAGIRIANHSGAVQTANNHIYGAYRAYENLGGNGGNHVNDYYADAYRGIHLEWGANENHFTNCLIQHCTQDAAFIGGEHNSFANCRFECTQSSQNWPNATGVILEHTADYTRFSGCPFGVNIWQNPADPGGNPPVYTAARTAIYINLEPVDPDPITNNSLDGVNISGSAYTIFGRAGDVFMLIDSTSDFVKSMTVDIDVDGFNDANDKLLVVVDDAQDTSFRNCKLVFRGNFGGNLNPDNVLDLPVAWNPAGGIDEGNSITIYDTFDGDARSRHGSDPLTCNSAPQITSIHVAGSGTAKP
jgi:hypothetical protein